MYTYTPQQQYHSQYIQPQYAQQYTQPQYTPQQLIQNMNQPLFPISSMAVVQPETKNIPIRTETKHIPVKKPVYQEVQIPPINETNTEVKQIAIRKDRTKKVAPAKPIIEEETESETYSKPRESMQDRIKDPGEIKRLLKGYTFVRHDKYHELQVGTPIRYITSDGKFRFGGTLVQNCAPKFLRLSAQINSAKTWTMSLTGSKVYAMDLIEYEEREREKELLYQDIKASGLTREDIKGIIDGRLMIVDNATYQDYKQKYGKKI